MASFLDFLENEHQNEHQVMTFTMPQIYHGGKNYDLNKRWYIRYKYFDPVQKKLVRQSNIYLGVNQFKTKRERLRFLKVVKSKLVKALENGWSPYEQEFFIKEYTCQTAIEYALEQKKNVVSEKTYKHEYERYSKLFLQYLSKYGYEDQSIESITKQMVMLFLKNFHQKPSTYNSTRQTLSALFGVMVVADIIPRNFIIDIPKLKVEVTRNLRYTDEQEAMIRQKLSPSMTILINFMSYCFLRPLEACRLKWRDIDFENKVLTVQTKTSKRSTKLIPTIMMDFLLSIDTRPENDYIVRNTQSQSEIQAREYFTKEFMKIKKELGLNKDHTMYSFRHTYITKVYSELKASGVPNVYDVLRSITGHRTEDALKKYLRDVGALLPQDYTHLIT